jgi:hypothetical protein
MNRCLDGSELPALPRSRLVCHKFKKVGEQRINGIIGVQMPVGPTQSPGLTMSFMSHLLFRRSTPRIAFEISRALARALPALSEKKLHDGLNAATAAFLFWPIQTIQLPSSAFTLFRSTC